jgi:DNA-binding NarL/FixJ family response regulator
MMGLRDVLAPHYEIVAQVQDGMALLEAAERLQPDVIVMDISMPVVNGIEAATRLKKTLPRTKLLMVTVHASPAYVEAALQAGARGYILKSGPPGELLEAVAAVCAGRLFLSAQLSESDPVQLNLPPRQTGNLRLSAKERENLQLISEGKSAKEVAALLNISVKTADFHRDNLKKKLGLRNTAELIRYAIEQRLVGVT